MRRRDLVELLATLGERDVEARLAAAPRRREGTAAPASSSRCRASRRPGRGDCAAARRRGCRRGRRCPCSASGVPRDPRASRSWRARSRGTTVTLPDLREWECASSPSRANGRASRAQHGRNRAALRRPACGAILQSDTPPRRADMFRRSRGLPYASGPLFSFVAVASESDDREPRSRCTLGTSSPHTHEGIMIDGIAERRADAAD